MALKENFELMASYNQWMNTQIYTSVAHLDAIELSKDRGAFFGSILGTLNHILVGDIIWLKRFSDHPSNYQSLNTVRLLAPPTALSEILYPEFDMLFQARNKMDADIINFIAETSEKDYEYGLPYRNTKGLPFVKKFGLLVNHLFNHQTHHRGQLTTILNQQNIEVGITDLLAVIPEFV